MTFVRFVVAFILLITLVSPGHATSLVQADLLASGDGLLTVDAEAGLEWLDVDQTVGLTFSEIVLDNAGGWRDLGFRHATSEEIDRLFAAAGLAMSGALNAQDFGAATKLIELLGCTSNCDTNRRAQLGIAAYGSGTLIGFGPTVVVFTDTVYVSVEADAVTGLGRGGTLSLFGGFDFLGGRPVFVTGGLEKVVIHGIEGPGFLEEFAVLSDTDSTGFENGAFPGVGHYLVRAVPEPATAVLLTLGLAALGYTSRRSGSRW